jgi:hypothetical protein
MKCLDYEIYFYTKKGIESFIPAQQEELLNRLHTFKLQLREIYRDRKTDIIGINFFHYDEQFQASFSSTEIIDDTISRKVQPGDDVFFIKVRLLVIPEAWENLMTLIKVDLLTDNPLILGYRQFNSYNPKLDIGNRFGDLEQNIDPFKEIMQFKTVITELMFFFLDFPQFPKNHDLIHLYLNTIGCNYEEEISVLHNRLEKISTFKYLFGFQKSNNGEIEEEKQLVKYS